MKNNLEAIQLLNTAIIKSREKLIDSTYEERLTELCVSPVMESINQAITHLAEQQKISREQSAIQIIDIIRKLDQVWEDYVMMEGIDKLKHLLNKKNH